jgi:hypothetical protein
MECVRSEGKTTSPAAAVGDEQLEEDGVFGSGVHVQVTPHAGIIAVPFPARPAETFEPGPTCTIMQTGHEERGAIGLMEELAMTESEWLAADDPFAMIEFLHEKPTHFRTRWQGWLFLSRHQVSERKWRLFYCACCDRIKPLFPGEETRRLLEVNERFADGQAKREDILEAWQQWRRYAERMMDEDPELGAEWHWARGEATNAILYLPADEQRVQLLRAMARAWASARCAERVGATGVRIHVPNDPTWGAELDAEAGRQASLLRDVVGNPFHPAVVDPLWLAWEGGTIPRIARSIYEQRRFEELPILADALEDAGCGDEAILHHCRAEAEHVRGCWALDALLNKT